jgi:hypothetical protein
MKKIFSILVIALLAINTQAQLKEKKAFDETMETINEMDQMLGKDFKQITSALEAVNGASFVMGDCIVLGAYADEGFKKNCKTMQAEFEKEFNKSSWIFDKYEANNQSLVKVTNSASKTQSSPYTGFAGSGTIKMGMLIEGLVIDAYFYQSKTDKNKYIMMFPVQQMGVFVELTKKDAKTVSNNVVKDNTAAPNATSKKNIVIPITTKKDVLKDKIKGKIGKKIKL